MESSGKKKQFKFYDSDILKVLKTIGPIGITLDQADENFHFIMDLTETQRVCWKITKPDGASVMIVPVNEIAPVPTEIQDQVEDFRKKFIEKDAS